MLIVKPKALCPWRYGADQPSSIGDANGEIGCDRGNGCVFWGRGAWGHVKRL